VLLGTAVELCNMQQSQ